MKQIASLMSFSKIDKIIQNKGENMKRVFKANLYFLIILVLEIFLPIPLSIIYKILRISDIRLILALNHFILFLVPAIIYVIVTKCNIKETFKIKLLSIKEILLVILLGIGSLLLTNFFGVISSLFFENEVGQFINQINGSPYIILLLLIAIMPSITEEITLRGIILSGYDGKSKVKAALISGLFFGMFHLNLNQFIYTAVLGFILAYTVRVTGSIFSSMIIHFIINGTSITLNKIISIVNPTVISEMDNVNMLDYSLTQKLTIIGASAIYLVLGGIIVFFVLKKLQKISDVKNGLYKESVIKENNEFFILKEENTRVIEKHREKENSKEKIINWPFIVAIIFYIFAMTITVLLKSLILK